MKRLILLTLLLTLTLLFPGNTLAAVHNFTGDFTNYYLNNGFVAPQFNGLSFDGWYTIDKDSPGATVRALFPKNDSYWGIEYYQNDQHFANLNYFDDDTVTSFQGSYLFDIGLFVGVDYADHDGDTQGIISPGYRYAFGGDKGYIAASVDYALSGDLTKRFAKDDSGIVDYDLDFKYFTDNLKVYGQLLIPNDDMIGPLNQFISDDPILDLAANYRLNENYVVGGALTAYDKEFDYNLGVTGTFDKLGAEVRYRSANYDGDNQDYGIDANILYSFTEQVRAGFQVTKAKGIDDPYLYAKAKITINDDHALKLIYQFKNNDADEDGIAYIRWDMSIK